MEDDYLASEFAKAQEKLERALATCESCPPSLRATLIRDSRRRSRSAGVATGPGASSASPKRLRIDPNVALDKDTKNKEIEAAFAEAKKRAAEGFGSRQHRSSASERRCRYMWNTPDPSRSRR
jgi:hypothetical protein